MPTKVLVKTLIKAFGSTKPKVDVLKLASDMKKAADKKKATKEKAAAAKEALVKEKPTEPKSKPKAKAEPKPAPKPTEETPKKPSRHPDHDVGVSMLKTLGFKHAEADASITNSVNKLGVDVPINDIIKTSLKDHASNVGG